MTCSTPSCQSRSSCAWRQAVGLGGALAIERARGRADVLVGVIPVEDLDPVRKHLRRQIPDPRRPAAEHDHPALRGAQGLRPGPQPGVAKSSGDPRTATTWRATNAGRRASAIRSSAPNKHPSFTSCQRPSTKIMPPSMATYIGVSEGGGVSAGAGSCSSHASARSPSCCTTAWSFAALTPTPANRWSNTALAGS